MTDADRNTREFETIPPAPTAKRDEWDGRAHNRLWNWCSGTCAASIKLYGQGSTGKRLRRMDYLRRARDTWLLDMRTTPREDITQGYADTMWQELMEAAEQAAARDILGDEGVALRYVALVPAKPGRA